MVKHWEQHYHEDEVEKKNISKPDFEFLKDLQKELNTQDTMVQANPRFWVIRQSEYVVVPKDFGDGIYTLCDQDGDAIFKHEDDDESMLSAVVDWFNSDLDEDDYFLGNTFNDVSYDSYCCLWKYDDDKQQTANMIYEYCDLDELVTDLNDRFTGIELNLFDEIKTEEIVLNTFFLTQKEADEYLDRYAYQLDKEAHTFAMTASVSPNFERVLKLLQTTNFECKKGSNMDGNMAENSMPVELVEE